MGFLLMWGLLCDVGHKSVGNFASFLPMDMEHRVGCNMCNFA